jgi:hypothetical protein
MMGKSKGNKYSSYLDNVGQLRLEKFCSQFDCSKAKAISYLLELWENGTLNNKLATVNDDIYSQLETKLESFINSKIENQLNTVNQEISSLKNEVTHLSKEIKKH